MTAPVVIAGGGYTGLAAAYDLARAGREVEIVEASDALGGLAGSFELTPGRRVEKFYHHWFSSDRDILGFLDELGLGQGVRFAETNTGLYFANSVFRLAKPWDLLTFSPLPFVSRVRTGLMALAARRVKDWRALESMSADEWIIKYAGLRSYEVIWKPLLYGKFGAEAPHVSAVWIANKLKLRGSSRNSSGAEQLAYYAGGFGGATDAIAEKLKQAGVRISLNAPVERIITENGRATGVRAGGREIAASQILATMALPEFLELAPELPQTYRDLHGQIRFLGNVCLVLRLNRSLSETYWLNVADPSFPFVGVIEHTNFDPVEHYGGEHIVYLSKYLSTEDRLFKLSDDEFYRFALPHLQRIFPALSEDWIIGYKTWRARYSQPVVTKHYSRLIPPLKTPIENLYLATMAQVYPEDRGTSYAVRLGRQAARELLA